MDKMIFALVGTVLLAGGVSAACAARPPCPGGDSAAPRASRMDRSKFHIGVWRYREYLHDEAHVKELAKCGVDYVCMDKGWDNRQLLDLFQKYGIGVCASGPVPRWGVWLEHGGWHRKHPLSDYDRAAEKFADHPALWAVNILDETSALDFPYAGEVVERMRRLFPNQFCYFDINPNYATTATNDTLAAKVHSQLGVRAYADYIAEYCRSIPVDFISYDYFPYSRTDKTRTIQRCWENYLVVADACRASGRSLWFAPQVNSRFPEKWTTENQLRFQAYSSMAFGAEAIAWCCWSAGWWTNQVIDVKGERTEQYDKLKRVNAELRRLAPAFMRYRNTATHFVGFRGTPWLERTACKSVEALNTGYFRSVKATDSSPLVVGEMVARAGYDKGRALFVFAADDPLDEKPTDHRVTFHAANPHIKVVGVDGPVAVEHREDGDYEFPIKSNHCLIIMQD